ncbi:MAG: protein kinase [Myxococcota bacterium]
MSSGSDSKTLLDEGDRPSGPATQLLGTRLLGEPAPSLGLSPSQPVQPGQTAGRYLVLERLGHGGMSVVYIAYDPQLDRRVALKLMRPDTGESDRQVHARLLREGKAMARLAHPNVVRVYDVGIMDEQVYMAMELVEGHNLRDWLELEPRSWRQVIDVMVQAGRGLAAAHAAGLVHLDVTPRNVLVGHDGEVRMVDFGLARQPRAAAPSSSSSPSESSPTLEATEPLTKTGMVMGTPGYMAPEQLDGEPPDDRSDQFSFCVTTWEALFGQRPFPGVGLAAYKAAVHLDRIRDPPSTARVPARLRRLLERGLRSDRRDRYPTLTELLDALADDPRRRWFGRAAVVAVIASVGVGAWVSNPPRADPCEHVESRLHDAWDETRRSEVRRRLDATSPDRPEANAEVVDLLDEYAESWVAESTDACQAANVQGRQSAELLDLRDYCLQHRLQALAAIPELISSSEARSHSQWRDAILRLPEIAGCHDVTSVQHVGRPPEDPRVRASVQRLGPQVAKARALFDAGYVDGAIDIAQGTLRAARAAQHPPLIAEVEIVLAEALTERNQLGDAERHLYESLALADAGDMQQLQLRAIIQVLYTVGVVQGRAREAENLARWGLILEETAVHSPEHRAHLLSNLGMVYLAEGRASLGRDTLEQSLALRRDIGLRPDLNEASTIIGLGGACLGVGEPERALEHYRSALALLRDKYGPRHPSTLVALEDVALALHSLERFEEALQHADEAVEGSRDNEQRGSSAAFSLHATRGAILFDLMRLDEAEQELESVRRAFAESAQNPARLGVVEGNLALIALEQGRPADALRLTQQGRPRLERQFGANHMLVGWMVGIEARAELAAGSPVAALPLAQQAMQILGTVEDPQASDFRSDAALVISKALVEPEVLADPALVERGGAGRSALEWAGRALDEAKAGGRSSQPALARARAWLDRQE